MILRPERGDGLVIVSANEVAFEDVQSVFSGASARCQCQRQRLADRDWWPMSVEQRAEALRAELACGEPDPTPSTGVIALLDGEAIGWCAVDRRASYQRIRNSPIAWTGRREDKDDPSVWAIACLVVRAGFRRQGLTYELIEAATSYAWSLGASAVEGYPLDAKGATITWDELNVGAINPFLAANYREVSRPSVRRVVMRIDRA